MASRQLDEEAIFHTARKIENPEARTEYLEQVCAGDVALRSRVESLLEAHEQEQDFLRSPREPGPTFDQPPMSEGPGTQIGRYKLLQKIGEGGFGVVYMAEQHRPVRRKVALKVIKPGMDTQAVVARFEAERQALALMDHPNISRVLDGGTTESGRPYFVMELVKGVPITEYCDANNLTAQDRLQLFVTVCQAVQHAHQKGIIHRDLKPSNILITLHDGRPVVKVIDFGVAKAINQQLTERTLFTAYGQMVGTPQYMSPEQAEMSGLDVDTRSDVYSLGVLLYELLTGTTPLAGDRLRTAGYAEMQRIIREEEPPKPSTRLSTSGERLTIIAKHRGVSPERLRRSVRGELDWVVMKALEKDRSRRYETASSLALDIHNYLSHEPLLAGPPSASYRLRKILRRHRGPALAVASVLLCLLVGIVGTTMSLRRAQDLRDEAVAAKAEADAAREVSVDSQRRAVVAQRRAEDSLYIADLQRAMGAIQKGNRREAERLLKRHERVGGSEFEWRLLDTFCRKNRAMTEFTCAALPMAGDISTDGRVLAICQTDGTVGLIDVPTRDRIEMRFATSGRNSFAELYVSLTRDGKYLAYPSDDPKAVRVRKLDTSEETTLADRHNSRIKAAVFCPAASRSWLATADVSGVITVWDWTTGKVVKERQSEIVAEAVSWSADGQLLASGGETCVSVWDVERDTIVSFHPSVATVSAPRVRDIAIAPDGRTVAIPCEDHTVRVWDIVSGELKATFAGHHEIVQSVVYVDDSTLASAGRDNVIRVWDVHTLREQRIFRGLSGYIWWLAGPTSDGCLASGGIDGNVMLWHCDASGSNEARQFDSGQVRDLALNPEGTLIAVANTTYMPESSEASELVVMDTADLAQKSVLAADYFVQSVTFSRDGSVACGGGEARRLETESTGRVSIWKSISDREPRTIQSLPGRVQYVRFSPDGQRLAASCGRGCIVVEAASVRWEKLSVGDRGFDGVAWSPDGKYLAAGSIDAQGDVPKLVVWDVSTRQVHFDSGGTEDHAEGVTCVTFSPNGRLLASGSLDGRIQLREMPGGKRVGLIETHSGFIWSLQFSPDNRNLFSGGGDHTVNIWDVERQELRLGFPAHIDGTKSLALSRDGSVLFSGGLYDCTLRVWRTGR